MNQGRPQNFFQVGGGRHITSRLIEKNVYFNIFTFNVKAFSPRQSKSRKIFSIFRGGGQVPDLPPPPLRTPMARSNICVLALCHPIWHASLRRVWRSIRIIPTRLRDTRISILATLSDPICIYRMFIYFFRCAYIIAVLYIDLLWSLRSYKYPNRWLYYMIFSFRASKQSSSVFPWRS